MLDVILVGVNTPTGLLRWIVAGFLFIAAIHLFRKRKEINANHPWIIVLAIAVVALPFLILDIIVFTPESTLAKNGEAGIATPKQEEKPVVPEQEETVPEVTPTEGETAAAIIRPKSRGVKPEEAPKDVKEVTTYKVLHEKMNADGMTYTLEKTEVLYATVGDVVTPDVYEYEHYVTPEKQTVTVAKNGTTLIDYRYNLEKFELTIYNEEFVNGGKSGNYYYGKEFSLDAVAREGYDFAGWSDASQSSQTHFVLTEDKVIGPNYAAHVYEVNFHANDERATGEMEAQKIIYDKETALNETGFKIPGYSLRWNTQADGSGTYYNDKQVVKNLSTGEAVDLYAIWTANTDTPYKVIHRKMTLNGDYAGAEEEIEEKKGTTDQPVTPAAKNYAGFTAPETRTEIVTGDGEMAIVYEYLRNKYHLKLENLAHIEADYRDKAGEYYYGETITVAAEASFPGAVFSKWNDGSTERIHNYVMPAKDAMIRPEYVGHGNFPVVFEQSGQCQFRTAPVDTGHNATRAEKMIGEDCSNFTDNDFINTGIQLFSEENYNKDFYVSFTIDEFDAETSGYRPTLMNATEEDESKLYPGIVFRRMNGTQYYVAGSNVVNWTDDEHTELVRKASKLNYVISSTQKVTFMRKSGCIYTQINNNPVRKIHCQEKENYLTTDAELWFGATYEMKDGKKSLFKFFNGKLSNIVVRLGADTNNETVAN
ncbi:InlB B-repeat-containing protein [Candidatus Saccharibacteria bacterium]|nr:InlB B-repeat-containing protein [Candidatus Saccharibacteria bacterium]